VRAKEFANVAVVISGAGDVARWKFILGNLPGKGAFLITQLK